jgi:hypothetical protein
LILGLIAEGERLKYLAIERMDKSATIPLEISSYSDKVKTSLDRLLMGGRMSPFHSNLLK